MTKIISVNFRHSACVRHECNDGNPYRIPSASLADGQHAGNSLPTLNP